MVAVEDIIAGARLREETATICVAGDLNAEHEKLSAELARLDAADWKPGSLADVNPRRDLAERIADVETRMAEFEHRFLFRALPHKAFRGLRRKHTSDAGILDVDEFLPALVVACCREPEFGSPAVFDQLAEHLTQGQYDTLTGAAWQVNTGAADIPKSARASALMAGSEPR